MILYRISKGLTHVSAALLWAVTLAYALVLVVEHNAPRWLVGTYMKPSLHWPLRWRLDAIRWTYNTYLIEVTVLGVALGLLTYVLAWERLRAHRF